MNKGIKIVAIGDMHAHPDYDLKRFRCAGEFVAEQQPDVLVMIGDFSDVVSLMEHGSKLQRQSARWKEDKEVTLDAMAEFMRPIHKRKRKMPRRIMTLGNHEHRIERWVGENPEFEGDLSVTDLGYERAGFSVIPWKQYVNIAGWHFVHEIGTKGRASTKATSPSYGVAAQGVSLVHGHTHEWECRRYPGRESNRWAVDLGSWVHKDMGWQESWSNPTEFKYWRGAWVIDGARFGDCNGAPRAYGAEELGD